MNPTPVPERSPEFPNTIAWTFTAVPMSSGILFIFRYEIATAKLDAVTNAETGFFRPIPLGGDDLIVLRYSGSGFVPVRIHATPLQDVSAITFLGERLAEEHPIIKTWNVGSPAEIRFDTLPKRTVCSRPVACAGVWSSLSKILSLNFRTFQVLPRRHVILSVAKDPQLTPGTLETHPSVVPPSA